MDPVEIGLLVIAIASLLLAVFERRHSGAMITLVLLAVAVAMGIVAYGVYRDRHPESFPPTAVPTVTVTPSIIIETPTATISAAPGQSQTTSTAASREATVRRIVIIVLVIFLVLIVALALMAAVAFI
jgi:hypothetical protein